MVLLASAVIGPFTWNWLLVGGGARPAPVATIRLLSLAFSILHAAGIALLLVGVFAGRDALRAGFEIPTAMPARY